MALTTKTFSLYDHICTFKSKKNYNATRLAQYLIQVLSRDACLTKWEASSLSRDLVSARVRYDQIHDWIGIVDSEQHANEAVRWDAFRKSPLVPTQNVISDGPDRGHRPIRFDVKIFFWPHTETTLVYLE
ncbi:hypothetical protein WG66_004309 [Moniliophthora roreri]|nr:hypothetical protein WG66_004309 [Moniliophthora roreri]